MSDDPIIRGIYVGAPIDQESERKFLAAAIRQLESQQIGFVVLANLHVGGRQIDCILATEHNVSVVEVKSSYLPVRGGLNGPWERLHASGEWRSYTNAYRQALDAKNAVRDVMLTTKPVGAFYPDGYVVFTSGLAGGSELPGGDFKVKVTTLERFGSSSRADGSVPWSLDDWRALASRLGLTPVSADDVIASKRDRESAEVLRRYNAAFAAEYGRDANRWLAEDSHEGANLRAAANSGAGCFITGPSGCGKTLLAKWLAVDQANAGNPILFFQARDFTGSWAAFIRREIALLCDLSPATLFRAISSADRPVFLVLDGINELGARSQTALRGVRALARRLGGKLIITGQEGRPPELDGLGSVAVRRPSVELKRRIAQSGNAPLSRIALEVLKAVGSGIEADIVREIGSELRVNATRLLLIDQYVRLRLGGHGRAGPFGLRKLASWLHERVAFSISEADFDEFMRPLGVGFAECDALFATELLVRRAGRISFAHEMIQNACAAFDLARQAAEDPVAFGFRLSMPILEGIAGDVVSAIEDPSTCRTVLQEVTNSTLLAVSAVGELGEIPRSVARNLLAGAADGCAAEIRSARLVLVQVKESLRVDWEGVDGRRHWTEPERARLRAIGHCAACGADLDTYLGLCVLMDECLANERRRLAEVAREAKFPLRSNSFALAYRDFGGRIGFNYVSGSAHCGLKELPFEKDRREFRLASMSSGQLLFFFENRHALFDGNDAGHFADELANLFRERFRWEPYHVQLTALHAVGFARNAPEGTLERLINAIKGIEVRPDNWAIGSSVVDALKWLGALDKEGEGAREQVKRELASVLGGGDEATNKDHALSLCVSMFDHPFDSIYWEEIQDLDEAVRRRLYRRALGASDIKRSMSLDWLSREVASFEDASDAPLFQRLATLPDPSNPFPQEEWGGFVMATRFLGRHGAALPAVEGETAAERCLADIRTLIYAAESRRQPDQVNAQLAWHNLHSLPAQLVIGCLGEVDESLTARHWAEAAKTYSVLRLAEVYPSDCLNVARKFVDAGVEAQGFHRVPMREVGPLFAFGTMGRHGDRSDIERLRRLSRAHSFARYALTAIKLIDAVTSTGE